MKPKQIEVVPYNPDWPQMFVAEAELIKQTLKDKCISVHHIGSTSVHGLSAKPYIDILCIVRELQQSLQLEDIGYVFKGEFNVPLRYCLSKESATLKIKLHAVESDNGFIDLNLCFRDYLRANPDACTAYTALKAELAHDPEAYKKIGTKFKKYTLNKNQFIKSILDKAGFDKLVINYCMHDAEWEEYHRIRDEQLFSRINIQYDRTHTSLTDPNFYHFILYKGTSIVTVMMAELLNEEECVCRSLATDPPYQRHGYGRHMMNFLEKWAVTRGCKVIKLHAALEAECFYRTLGYVDMEFNDPCIREKHIDLGKAL